MQMQQAIEALVGAPANPAQLAFAFEFTRGEPARASEPVVAKPIPACPAPAKSKKREHKSAEQILAELKPRFERREVWPLTPRLIREFARLLGNDKRDIPAAKLKFEGLRAKTGAKTFLAPAQDYIGQGEGKESLPLPAPSIWGLLGVELVTSQVFWKQILNPHRADIERLYEDKKPARKPHKAKRPESRAKTKAKPAPKPQNAEAIKRMAAMGDPKPVEGKKLKFGPAEAAARARELCDKVKKERRNKSRRAA